MIRRISFDKPVEEIDFITESLAKRLLVRTRPGADARFEERMLKHLSSVAKNFRLKTISMEEARISANKQSMIFPTVLLIISGFLIINVALGLFGVMKSVCAGPSAQPPKVSTPRSYSNPWFFPALESYLALFWQFRYRF